MAAFGFTFAVRVASTGVAFIRICMGPLRTLEATARERERESAPSEEPEMRELDQFVRLLSSWRGLRAGSTSRRPRRIQFLSTEPPLLPEEATSIRLSKVAKEEASMANKWSESHTNITLDILKH